ncbi:MAG: hypothetical protein KDK70_25735 [Myxococcales bacterium]|nr:hypothetical protein [Myxococcales bacterium]
MAWSLPTPAVILGVLAAACTSHAPAPTEDAPAQHAPTKHDPAQHAPAPLRPVAIDGDCAAGPPMGPLEAYARASATLIASPSGVRARSCAVWPADDLRNVVGTLASGQRIPVFGPVKHAPFSAGVGYVVPLVDPSGVHCRGYVSATVLEHVAAHASTGGADRPSLPDGRGAWTGPCLVTEEPAPEPAP